MATDVLGLGMALAAVSLASRGGNRGGRSFGRYRLEILSALANAVLLLGVAGYVLWEAVDRFGDAPDVDTAPVLVAATVGLAANVVAWLLRRDGATESLNVRGGPGRGRRGRRPSRPRVLLDDRYAIHHATLQVEPADHTGCDELSW